MPISYRIDAERNLVFTTASGTLTDDDVLELKRGLLADPAFKGEMRELSDIRSVTDLRVTAKGVQSMVALDAGHASRLKGYKLAIVAGQTAVFGMARMYQTLTENNLSHVGVFTDYETAAQWLGIAPQPRP